MALTDESMVMPVAPAYGGGGFGGGFGGDWAWILLLLVLFGGGGFGGGFGMDGLYPWMNNSQNINDGFRDQMLNTSISGISSQLSSNQISDLRIAAILSKHADRFPASFLQKNHITSVQTHDAIAKIIAHSCTQTALSQTFKEVFSFEGCEFYVINVDQSEGMTFEELTLRLDRAVPIGVFLEDGIVLNPLPQYVLKKEDRIIIFAEEEADAVLKDAPIGLSSDTEEEEAQQEGIRTVIIGQNETLPLILKELPENVEQVYLVCFEERAEALSLPEEIAKQRGFKLERIVFPSEKEIDLERIASLSEHIILLSDHQKEMDEADMETIFMILHLRDLRARLKLPFNITAEMCKESNQNLIAGEDHTDFVVSSSMSSLFLAQIAENPELVGVFHEILSNEGSELFLKDAEKLHLTGRHSVQELRKKLLLHRCILLGYLDRDKNSHFNPGLAETPVIETGDQFIVLSQQ